jgi:hypothetical protein
VANVGVANVRHRVVRATTAVAELTEEGYLVLDLGSGSYFTLDEVGGFIWDRLDAGPDLAGLVSAVTAEFEVGRERAEEDVARFVGELADAGLVRLEPW